MNNGGQNMNKLLNGYSKCAGLPFGRWVFSKMVCLKAPYFGTIKPVFQHLQPGRCSIRMKNRRAVHNHIQSVHAIAMCCLAELAAGTMLEVSLPPTMRWIPKGMQVQYLRIARSDLTAFCEIPAAGLDRPRELPITVRVEDAHKKEVFRAVIDMYITERKR